MLDRVITHRWIALGLFTALIAFTVVYAVPRLGHEFMPELEEGNLWVRGTFPLNISLERVTENADEVRRILTSYEEVETAVVQIGRPDDGTDSCGFFNIELFVPLRPEKQWPKVVEQTGWRRWLHGEKRARTKLELIKEMNAELSRKVPGVDFNFSQNIRDNVMEALSGIKGDNSVKIVGPDLEKLDDLAEKVRDRLRTVPGDGECWRFHHQGTDQPGVSSSIRPSARSTASAPTTSTPWCRRLWAARRIPP